MCCEVEGRSGEVMCCEGEGRSGGGGEGGGSSVSGERGGKCL